MCIRDSGEAAAGVVGCAVGRRGVHTRAQWVRDLLGLAHLVRDEPVVRRGGGRLAEVRGQAEHTSRGRRHVGVGHVGES
eukprot:6256337-Prymnesium_polylepis.1